MVVKYLVLEWDILDYGGRNETPHVFFDKESLLCFLQKRDNFDDINIYELKELKELEPIKSNIILKEK